MNVDNIFNLVNKFSKEEDQISATFGFILKNNKKVLNKFLKKILINVKPKELKKVDIETQTPYNSGNSIIDLQLTIYDKFLVFIESKLYKNEETICNQLLKYKNVLEAKRVEYDNTIRLIYVNKQPMSDETVKKLRKYLELSESEFFFFSWEDLIKITNECAHKETIKLFKEYIGDTMYAKKIIEEQKIKDIVEVLVIYTNPAFWELAEKKQIAVQKDSAPDARYLAFLRTHRGDGKRSAITHIAEVKHTESHVPLNKICKNFPDIIDHIRKRGKKLERPCKQYILQPLIKLCREIPHIKGEGTKAQVNFQTKMSELLSAKSIGTIRTLRKLEKSKQI